MRVRSALSWSRSDPCWLQDVRCGEVCGKKLRCGSHHCRLPCHRTGHCEDEEGQCKQPCGKAKKICGHPDTEDICHSPFNCKEDKPCQSKIFVTCECQAQKQEMKCGASKTSEGNNGKSLVCNEECSRLERNRKLAVALNIDQSTHQDGGDHIPYSTETLNLFAAHVKWFQTQEREFRVFATSADERRLRFKPMKTRERAFVHALADDFGLDSESVDPEPHRHVMIWKTPRFVAAPGKTLAEALRVRTGQASATASANVSDSEGVAAKRGKASNEVGEPYNGFLISSPRFGLTVEELRSELAKLQTLHVTFDVAFLPSDDVVLKAVSKTLSVAEVDHVLQSLKPALVAAITSRGFGTAQLCTTDASLNLLRRESDAPAGDGWSRVAAKRLGPRFLAPSAGVGGTNSFAALTGGNKVTFTKRKAVEKVMKKPKAVVVDDWEVAELAEEERESGVSGEEEAQGSAEAGAEGELAAADGDQRPAVVSASEVGDVAGLMAVVEDGGQGESNSQESGRVNEEMEAAAEDLAKPVEAQSWADEVEQAQA
ncbi:FKBP12-associated protein [Teratosphaeriaceae sp. CCFEE 6253]|nr:FKBP12-associated protein [Teratosphaeriaceae sp. CCFEE 6253]